MENKLLAGEKKYKLQLITCIYKNELRMAIKKAKTVSEDVPSTGSFSYFVSFDVLKTPLIFKAAKVYQKQQNERRSIK